MHEVNATQTLDSGSTAVTKPLKKTKDTNALFANVQAARAEYQDDPSTLQISIDTKAKVDEGDYARGGKNPDRRGRPGGEGLGS